VSSSSGKGPGETATGRTDTMQLRTGLPSDDDMLYYLSEYGGNGEDWASLFQVGFEGVLVRLAKPSGGPNNFRITVGRRIPPCSCRLPPNRCLHTSLPYETLCVKRTTVTKDGHEFNILEITGRSFTTEQPDFYLI
jgi:hypothetical protein